MCLITLMAWVSRGLTVSHTMPFPLRQADLKSPGASRSRRNYLPTLVAGTLRHRTIV